MQHLTEPDPFADALDAYMEHGKAKLELIRDDGYHNTEDVSWYFSAYRDFWNIEKPALKFARGRVLDIGCGAGRVALYLQRRGLLVTGIDSSPRVAALASSRGVRDVRVASACGRLPFARGSFQTIILFGNNLGICGSYEGLKQLLRQSARITDAHGRILATTRAPGTFKRKHRDYWNNRLSMGGNVGTVQLTLKFRDQSKTINWYLITPSALVELAHQTGWRLAELFGSGNADEGYSLVMEKISHP
jgi:SAM-dependent methyltransferase